MKTLHLMTQRNQPYGSERRCCEMCGLMMINREEIFWLKHVWVDDEKYYLSYVEGQAFNLCNQLPAAGPESNLQSSPAQPTKDETQS